MSVVRLSQSFLATSVTARGICVHETRKAPDNRLCEHHLGCLKKNNVKHSGDDIIFYKPNILMGVVKCILIQCGMRLIKDRGYYYRPVSSTMTCSMYVCERAWEWGYLAKIDCLNPMFLWFVSGMNESAVRVNLDCVGWR